jgi:hypothetical protein
MTVGDQVRPVAVFTISPNSNEDHWAHATWHAELAAREAAIAGATKGDMIASFESTARSSSPLQAANISKHGWSQIRRCRPSLSESG